MLLFRGLRNFHVVYEFLNNYIFNESDRIRSVQQISFFLLS